MMNNMNNKNHRNINNLAINIKSKNNIKTMDIDNNEELSSKSAKIAANRYYFNRLFIRYKRRKYSLGWIRK